MTPLTKKQIISHILNDGAILVKVYSVYSYSYLVFPNGTMNYNIRKNADSIYQHKGIKCTRVSDCVYYQAFS